ncbi:hypothetical protein KC887_06300, partial [Candidatus Kaiserbacteria bacterium]|nr:hypothetical protein [Candidatus Kaiserbacteria bacterium]
FLLLSYFFTYKKGAPSARSITGQVEGQVPPDRRQVRVKDPKKEQYGEGATRRAHAHPPSKKGWRKRRVAFPSLPPGGSTIAQD